jgi:hypothetical protein
MELLIWNGTRLAPLATLSIAMVAAPACTIEAPSDSRFGPQEIEAPDAGGEVGDLDRSGAQPVADLSGTWLLYSEVSTCVDIFEPEELLQRAVYLVEANHDAPPLVDETLRACEILLSPVLGMETTVTPALLSSTYPVVAPSGAATGASVGAGYTSGTVVELWGLAMDDPLREPFPTEPDDPRIVDLDGDGKPATSLPVGGSCETFIAQRSLVRFQGSFVAPDEIAGTVFSKPEELVVGATQSLCATRFALAPNFPRNRFRRIRVDGRGGAIDLDTDRDGEITCAEALPAARELFESRPLDHASCGGE